MRITRIGGPTALIEWRGWRLLTDPTFDDAGRTYSFGLGTSSRKTRGPAVAADALGDIDAVLVSHHHHADNLDDAGRDALRSAPTVVTTIAGARALGHVDARGLAPGQSTVLAASGRPSLTVTATPCRHGPPFTRPIVGPVVGFAITCDGDDRPGLWMTGDTVRYRAVERAAERLRPDVMLLHIGAVRFGLTGALKYTMDAADGAALALSAEPRIVVPLHVEGWSHFSEQEDDAARVLAATPIADRVRWLPLGEASEV